ncbi:hypothetical protein KJ966_14260 [bacterium]|nr:hypothetical protein [bacterium]
MPQIESSLLQDNESILIEERVDLFVERQRQLQQKLDSENQRVNQTISDLAKKSKSLPPEIVDKIFNPYLKQKISAEAVEEVRKSLHSMRLKINSLDPQKRYLILETMDFFRSKISIGKLIPAILLLKEEDKKKAFLRFVIPTFISINKNIETLVSTTELFSKESLHLNRGSLYSFVSDLAKTVTPVFKKEYLQKFSNIVSPVELLLNALKPFTNNSQSTENKIYSYLIDDEEKIRKILLDFIVAIQSHEALFNYAIKRHGYYKLFLSRLTTRDRFEKFEPILISKILAGCFLSNKQVKPSDDLIAAMVNREEFAKPTTIKAKRSFIDKLAPSTVFSIINQFKTHIQVLLKTTFNKEFSDVQDLSVKSILKKVWTGFSKLADEGLSKLAAPLEIIFNQIKKTLVNFLEEEKKEEEKAKKNAAKTFVALIPKREESVAFLKENYLMVEPNIFSFRGIREGANQKDYAYNSKFFQQGEITILEFTLCFKRLFEFLSNNNSKIKKVTHNKQQGIIEFHASFLFEKYLICLGLTRLKIENQKEVEEKNLFPYILLFTEDTIKKKGRIPSREIIHKQKRMIFNESVLLKENSIVFYKSILYILHLLPNKDWNSSASQSCVKFLIRELKKLSGPIAKTT